MLQTATPGLIVGIHPAGHLVYTPCHSAAFEDKMDELKMEYSEREMSVAKSTLGNVERVSESGLRRFHEALRVDGGLAE